MSPKELVRELELLRKEHRDMRNDFAVERENRRRYQDIVATQQDEVAEHKRKLVGRCGFLLLPTGSFIPCCLRFSGTILYQIFVTLSIPTMQSTKTIVSPQNGKDIVG